VSKEEERAKKGRIKILMSCSRARRMKRKEGQETDQKEEAKREEKRREDEKEDMPRYAGSKDAPKIHPTTITITQTTTSLPLRLDPIALTVRCDDLET
jgi:hypothetical protein